MREISCSRPAPIRLVPFSYFCTCWNVSPISLPSWVWLISSIIRRMRTRLPTCLSVELGDFFGMPDRLQRAVARVHCCLPRRETNGIHNERRRYLRGDRHLIRHTKPQRQFYDKTHAATRARRGIDRIATHPDGRYSGRLSDYGDYERRDRRRHIGRTT